MAADTQPLGYIGNLSPDQESRLRQFWAVVLNLLDAPSLGATEVKPDEPSSPSITRTETTVTAPGRTAYTDALGQALQTLGVSSADIRSVRDQLGPLTTDDMRRGLLSTAKHDHPDQLALRFLRARKWDVGQAFLMMLRAMVWRIQTMQVDERVIANSELDALQASQDSSKPKEAKAGKEFLHQMRSGKCFINGFDVEGRPVAVVRVRLHKPSEQSEEAMQRYILHVIETARLLLTPPTETMTILFDMTGFTLSNMEYPAVKFLIECFQANYPESLGVYLIHNAPWIFSGIWKIIRAWMDPVIASKVHFTYKTEELEKFIPRDQVSPEVGGRSEYVYDFVEPRDGENARMADTATRDTLLGERKTIGENFLRTTSEWLAAHKEKKDDQVQATTTRRDEEIEQLRVNYWALDPYVRGRNHMDRTGVIREGGKIQFGGDDAAEASTAKALEVEHVEGAKMVNVQ